MPGIISGILLLIYRAIFTETLWGWQYEQLHVTGEEFRMAPMISDMREIGARITEQRAYLIFLYIDVSLHEKLQLNF